MFIEIKKIIDILKVLLVINFTKIFKNFFKSLKIILFIFSNDESFYPKPTRIFEKKLTNLSSKKYTISACNGSTAIETALYSCDLIGKNIACAINMIPSSYYPAKTLKNKIFPVSINNDTLCMCTESLRKTLKEQNINGVIFCDYYGNYNDIQEIRKICDEFGVFLIRDCSHSHHFINKKEKSGGENEIICYSFQSSKGISTFEGGALCLDNSEICKKALFYISQDKFLLRIKQKGIDNNLDSFDFNGFGKKGRINPLGSIVGIIDLDYLNIQNWYMNEIIKIANYFTKKDNQKVKILGTNTTYYSCGCNTLVFYLKSKKEAYNFQKKLSNYGLNSYFRFYNFNNLKEKDFYNQDVFTQSINLFDRLVFVNINNLTNLKRILFIVLKSIILKK